MCLAIYKPAGKTLTKEYAEQAFKANEDGAGFAYVNPANILITEKGFMSFTSFWKAFKKVQQYEAIVHFRMATTGAVEKANTHPFAVTESFAMIHNGVIDIQPIEGRTDTETFATLVLEPIIKKYGPGILAVPAFDFLVRSTIGNSKLVLLSATSHYIINEKSGVWEDGIWYSNTSYKPFIASCYKYGALDSDDLFEYAEKREFSPFRIMTDDELSNRLDEIYGMIDSVSEAEAEELALEMEYLEREVEYRFEYRCEYEEVEERIFEF